MFWEPFSSLQRVHLFSAWNYESFDHEYDVIYYFINTNNSLGTIQSDGWHLKILNHTDYLFIRFYGII